MLKPYGIAFVIILSLNFVMATVGSGSGSEAVDTSSLSKIVLRVGGMTGGGGASLVRRALEGLKGVKEADVSFREKRAVVYFEKGKVTVDDMIRAVEKAGYRAALKQSPGKR